MQALLITMYDKVAQETIGPIHPFKAEPQAHRWFTQMMQQPQLQPTMDDIQLVQLGTIDTETLVITPMTPHKIMLNGITVRAILTQEASEKQ